MRWKRYEIPAWFIVDLFKKMDGNTIVTVLGLPRDTKVTSASTRVAVDGITVIDLFVESQEFAEITEGAEVPLDTLVFKDSEVVDPCEACGQAYPG